MTGPARIVRLAAILAALLFAALVVLSKGWLEPAGHVIFDSRLMGYDLADAQTYLSTLGEKGRLLYLGPFRWLDTAFPLLLTFALGGVIWLHTPRLNSAIRLLLLIVPAAYLMIDLAENALVGRMLADQYVVGQSVVVRASQLTQAKWLMMLASLLLAFGSWTIGRRAMGTE